MTDDSSTSGSERPDILHGDDPPGNWRHQAVGPCGITYSLPIGMEIDGVEVGEGEMIELALDPGDDRNTDIPQEERDIEIWYIAYPYQIGDRRAILYNFKSGRTKIGEAVGYEDAAKVAIDFMRENPGIADIPTTDTGRGGDRVDD